MSIWKKIKLYWLWIIGGVVALIAIISTFGNIFTNRSIRKTQEKIDDNEKKIDRVKGKEDHVKTEKLRVKAELDDLKKIVAKTKTTKRKPPAKKAPAK